ncbi:btuB [Symbiodinium microadriaticum]|nr:btuB [Symbiodinium microadriaticum]
MIRKLLVSGIATGVAMTAYPALAQTAGTQVIEEIEVISTTRRSEGLAGLNAAVSVIGQEELNLVQPFHYQQALNRLPGVNVHRNNGQESLASIRSPVLTGAGACGAFLVAENGIPLRSSGFCNVNEMFDAHTENAERIEVVRGPGSAFWGSNAVHGLINVVLPEPGDVGSLRVEAGPRGSYRVKGAIGYDYGNFKQTLLLNGVSEEGYRDDSGVDQQKASWLYNYTTDNGTELDGGFTVSNLNQETAGFVVGTEAYKDDVLRKTNPNPEAYRDSRATRVWTSFSRTVNDWDLVLTPYWREVNMSFIQHFLPGQPVEDFEHRSLGLQAAGYRTLPNGAELALGVDIEDTNASLLEFQPNPTEGSAFLRNTIPQGKHYDYEVEAILYAGFVNYEQALNDDWNISLGLRLESIEYDYDNLMIDGRTNELGATELYRLQNRQTVADLESVELDSFELAFTGAGESWDYTVSAYHMSKENEILRDSSRTNQNGSHTEHEGLEFELGVDITDTLSLRGVANFTKHIYKNSLISGGVDIEGNDIDTAPNIFGNARLTWRPTSALMAELEWVNMGEYFTNPENTASYEGHDLLNLRGMYEVDDDITLSLNVLNVTNEKYAERADWTTFTGDRYFPGQEVRAFFAINWNFR